MKLICHNSTSTIYDDGENWVCKNKYTDKDRVISKTEFPLFPLSAVVKHDFTEDDKPILDELRKKALSRKT